MAPAEAVCDIFENVSRPHSQAGVLSVLLSIFGSDQGVFDRQYRLYRQFLSNGSGLDCAK